jgi:tRNA (cytidine/uridine-2'-O-)-methyltransferase
MADLAPAVPPLRVVLVSPQIPPNTGNVVRTCAVTGCELHLVEPLGFSLEEKALRRAGLDYWEGVSVTVHAGWRELAGALLRDRPGRLHLFTARAGRSALEADYAPGDLLVFGQEQLGLPPALIAAHPDRCVSIPMRPGSRSLNLAVAVGVGVYAAIRSLGSKMLAGG